MKPGELYWSLVEKVWDAISIYDGPHLFLQQFNDAEAASRTLFAAHWCQSEVLNGGLHQFFWNSTGILAPEAVEAYRMIQLPKLAAVLEEALQWFGPAYPRDVFVRRGTLDSLKAANPNNWNPFKAFDFRFNDFIESENGGFEAAADAYARRFAGR